MNIIKQIIIVFTICFIGEIISMFLPIPFPGSVLAMVILFFCLLFRVVKVGQIREISEFLVKNMTLLFIPATVSIIEYTDILKDVFWRFLFICFVTTVICFVCTAYSVKAVICLMQKWEERKNKNA